MNFVQDNIQNQNATAKSLPQCKTVSLAKPEKCRLTS